MEAQMARRRLTGALVAASIVVLSACSSPTTPPPAGLNLQGLWMVDPAPGTTYGAGGTTTLEFGSAKSGFATFLSRSSSNDVTTCAQHVFALLSQNAVLLDEEYYIADEVDADTVVLDNETDSLTLTRVTGAAPVEPCEQASVQLLDTYPEATTFFTSLNGFGDRLYFNIDDNTNSIVSYDVSAGTFGAARQYTQSVSGGTHRMVVGARSDDLFYGHCACGGSTSVDHFNLATNTSIVDVDTEDLGQEIGIRHGFFADGMITIGGRDRDDSDVNRLLTLNPDTLALVSQREILPAASIDDSALLDDQVIALVDGRLVLVGNDGRAEETVSLTGLNGEVTGVATLGPSVYVVVNHTDNEAGVYEVTLP